MQIHHREFCDHDEAEQAIVGYIEAFFHRRCSHQVVISRSTK